MDCRLIILFGQWNKMGLEPSFSLVTVRNRLAEVFGHRVIALHHDVEWPPRSPDLTCDFFFGAISRAKCSLPLLLTLQLYDKESSMSLMLYDTRPQ